MADLYLGIAVRGLMVLIAAVVVVVFI